MKAESKLYICPKAKECILTRCAHREEHPRKVDPQSGEDYCKAIGFYCPDCQLVEKR